LDEEMAAEADEEVSDSAPKGPGFLGLSRNLWRLAAVMGIAQISVALWKWEFGIFLKGFLQPWQIAVVFSTATFTGLIGSISAGYIADFIGRRRTIALGLIPSTIGLFLLSYIPVWPMVAVQYGLVWFGMTTARLMSRAIPADEIASDGGLKPARRMMMVMMPLWFFDALGPLTGSFALSSGYLSSNLHFTGALLSVVAFGAAMILVRESLVSDVIEKARTGPKIQVRGLGREFWFLALGMFSYSFAWSSAVPYLGNLSVGPWDVDVVTYGLSWSLFSLMAALIMYPASNFADRNLKRALLAGVLGNGLVFIWFGLGTGVVQMYLINFVWALPFVLWTGAERSIIVLVVSEETKGRALGTYDLMMGIVSTIAMSFGGILWQLTDSLRLVWLIAGSIMVVCFVLLFPILRHITSFDTVETTT
jgi:MFS family permease